jgi:hypothetical protein
MPDSGTRSDQQPTLPWDPPSSRRTLRLTIVYATDLRHSLDDADQPRPPGDVLRLSRLADFYARSADQLPQILARHDLEPTELGYRRWRGQAEAASFWIIVLPSRQVMMALSLDIAADLLATIPLLEDLYYADITVAETALQTWAIERFADEHQGGGSFLPERHQLVFASIPDEAAAPSRDVLQRVIYRADIASRPGSDAIRIPAELNRRPTTVGAIGSYVSVIAGHQEYLENTAFLSAAQIVGSAAQLRRIRERAYECVRDFRENRDEALPVRQRRLTFERIADLLGELELDLSFSVEATADLGLLIPSLRVESYHNDLYQSMNLAHRVETTSHMLARLRNAIGAELASVTSIEDRADDARRTRTVGAVTFISTIAGTLALLFGFFGINAAQVDDRASMFDHRYLPIYLLVVVILMLAVGIYFALAQQERRQTSNRGRQSAAVRKASDRH